MSGGGKSTLSPCRCAAGADAVATAATLEGQNFRIHCDETAGGRSHKAEAVLKVVTLEVLPRSKVPDRHKHACMTETQERERERERLISVCVCVCVF
jgi:hypothetical protein